MDKLVASFNDLNFSPTGENMSQAATDALRLAALAYDFVISMDIPSERFFDLALQSETGMDVYECILKFVKERQK